MQTCILPYKRTTRKIRSLLSVEVCATKCIGEHNEKEVILKRGQYGVYVEYDNRKISLKSINKDFGDISIADVIYSIFIIICYSFMVHSFHKAMCVYVTL